MTVPLRAAAVVAAVLAVVLGSLVAVQVLDRDSAGPRDTSPVVVVPPTDDTAPGDTAPVDTAPRDASDDDDDEDDDDGPYDRSVPAPRDLDDDDEPDDDD